MKLTLAIVVCIGLHLCAVSAVRWNRKDYQRLRIIDEENEKPHSSDGDSEPHVCPEINDEQISKFLEMSYTHFVNLVGPHRRELFDNINYAGHKFLSDCVKAFNGKHEIKIENLDTGEKENCKDVYSTLLNERGKIFDYMWGEEDWFKSQIDDRTKKRLRGYALQTILRSLRFWFAPDSDGEKKNAIAAMIEKKPKLGYEVAKVMIMLDRFGETLRTESRSNDYVGTCYDH